MFRRKSRSGIETTTRSQSPPQALPSLPSLNNISSVASSGVGANPSATADRTAVNSAGHRVLRKGSATSLGTAAAAAATATATPTSPGGTAAATGAGAGPGGQGKARVVNQQVIPGRPSGFRSDQGHAQDDGYPYSDRTGGGASYAAPGGGPFVPSQIPYPSPNTLAMSTSASSPDFGSYNNNSNRLGGTNESPNAVYGAFPTPPTGPGRRSIASLYPSSSNLLKDTNPKSSSDSTTALAGSNASIYSIPKSISLPNVRRAHKLAAQFNIIVVGARRTGKSSLISSLVTSLPSSSSSPIKKSPPTGTSNPSVTSITSMEYFDKGRFGGGEKVALNLVDTKGLDIPWGLGRLGDELEVERQLSGVLKECERRFDETLLAESQVVRPSNNLHDNHIHCLLYLIHPESISTRPKDARKTKISLGAYRRSLTGSQRRRKVESNGEEGGKVEDGVDGGAAEEEEGPTGEGDGEKEDEEELMMSELDLRCLQKLSRRVNVIPLLARSDELSISQITAYKTVILSSLSRIGLLYPPPSPTSIVDSTSRPIKEEEPTSPATSPQRLRGRAIAKLKSPQMDSRDSSKSGYSTADQGEGGGGGEEDEADDGPSEAEQGEEEEDDEEEEREEPVRLIKLRSNSTRALLSPKKRAGSTFPSQDDGGEDLDDVFSSGGGKTNGNGHVGGRSGPKKFDDLVPFTVMSPEPNKGEGKFVREFRYGTIDLLNPLHTDFLPMRNALLGSQIRIMKESTRLDKYEPFRTQRLISRRETRAIGDAKVRKELVDEIQAI